MKLVPTDTVEICHNHECSEIGSHEVTYGEQSLDVRFCCDHMDEFMFEVGKPQSDFKAGFAKFQKEHLRVCGYKPESQAEQMLRSKLN